MTEEEIEKLARGLTEAQRRAMCPNDAGWAAEHKGKGFANTITTAAKLFNRGLFAQGKNLSPLTPLGQQVRAHLERTSQ